MGPLTSPPAQTPSADGSSDTNDLGTEQAPPPVSMSDDLMADIDWVSCPHFSPLGFSTVVKKKKADLLTLTKNEWDKLFPPSINTGELNLVSFGH